MMEDFQRILVQELHEILVLVPIGVGIRKQAVVQTNLGIHSVGALHPMQCALGLDSARV